VKTLQVLTLDTSLPKSIVTAELKIVSKFRPNGEFNIWKKLVGLT